MEHGDIITRSHDMANGGFTRHYQRFCAEEHMEGKREQCVNDKEEQVLEC